MLLALLGVLGLGVARLLALRAAQGDVYARYSTLRSDPFGARILMEGLREIDGLRVRRNTAPLGHLWEDPDETLFLLGASPLHLDSDASDDDLEIEALVRQGARAVIAVAPVGDAKSAKEDETDKTRLEPPTDDDPVWTSRSVRRSTESSASRWSMRRCPRTRITSRWPTWRAARPGRPSLPTFLKRCRGTRRSASPIWRRTGG